MFKKKGQQNRFSDKLLKKNVNVEIFFRMLFNNTKNIVTSF